ncbi:MAG: TolC family protein [Aquificaceae bacterium]|nr:TolC family protein [Aquificaceae bacterium]
MFILILLLICFSYGGELESLINYALENSPRIRAYRSMIGSIEYREGYSRSLPNPFFSLALTNLPVSRPYPNKYEPMSGLSLGISQMYILPLKRERDALIIRSERELLRAQEEIISRELVRDIKLAYLDWLYSTKKKRLLEETLKDIKGLEKLAEESYRFGRVSLSELFSLRAESLKIEREMESLRQEIRLREEEIGYMVGGRVRLVGEEPVIKEVEFEALEVEKSPYVRVSFIQRERTERELQRRMVEHLPDIELMVDYMIRPSMDNTFSLRVNLSFPLYRSVRERLMVLEKQEEKRARDWELEVVKLETKRSVWILSVEAERLKSFMAKTQKMLEEKEGELKAMEIAYRFGKVGLGELLKLRRDLWELRRELLELELSLKKTMVRAEVFL